MKWLHSSCFCMGASRCTCHQWTQLKLKLTYLYHILGARVILTDIHLLPDIGYFSFLSFLFLICKVKLCALFLSQDHWEEQIRHRYRSHTVLTYRFKVLKGLLTHLSYWFSYSILLNKVCFLPSFHLEFYSIIGYNSCILSVPWTLS